MFAALLSRSVRFSGRRSARRRRNCLPQLLALEDRTLFSTFTVLNLNDSGPGSLRAEAASTATPPQPQSGKLRSKRCNGSGWMPIP